MSKHVRRRHRQHDVLSECPEFVTGQRVVRVTQAQGENIYEVITAEGEKALYRLPKRLRHVVYIRRGSYLFVRDDTALAATKLCGEIEIVVLDTFLRTLQTQDFWPQQFKNEQKEEEEVERKEGIDMGIDEDEESDHHSWEAGMGNPNRPKWVEDSDEEDSSDDD